MPFQSEKQRKYLWANEPAIAREWTDKYGSRVKKQLGGKNKIIDLVLNQEKKESSEWKRFCIARRAGIHLERCGN